jgi:N-methylhydantoinase B
MNDLGGRPRLLPYCDFDFKDSDVLYTRHGNGGGYGDPLEREPNRVLNDVLNGYVSKELARNIYGVVFTSDTLEIDYLETRRQRDRLREERLI